MAFSSVTSDQPVLGYPILRRADADHSPFLPLSPSEVSFLWKTGVRNTRVLTDQYVLSWIGALHSSCPSNWMRDPSWACSAGEMLQRGMRPEQCSKTSRLQPLLLLFCWQRNSPRVWG